MLEQKSKRNKVKIRGVSGDNSRDLPEVPTYWQQKESSPRYAPDDSGLLFTVSSGPSS